MRMTRPAILAALGLCLSACGLAPNGLFDPRPGAGVEPAPGGTSRALSLDDLCGGALAEETFRYGLCVCDDLDLAGELRTSSLRSSTGQPGRAGGVGVNGHFSTAGAALIDGSLVVGGDLIPAGEIALAGELRTGGDLVGAGTLSAAGDVFVAGELAFIGLEVGGTLHTTREQSLFFTEASAAVVEDFAIDAPCGCERALPVAELVAEAAGDNDNAAAGLDPGALARLAGAGELELGAGQFFLDGINAAGEVRLVVTGPAELFVAGDLSLAGALVVELATPEASLDLFVDGDISAAGELRLGDPERPAGVRVYLADDGELTVAGALDLDGALHAPGTTLAAAGELSITGAVTVGRVAEAGALEVVYDADLNDAGDACAPPELGEADPSGPSEEEPGCEVSLDCPDPQICIEGACVLFEG